MASYSPTLANVLEVTEKFQEEGKQQKWTKLGYFVYM